MDIYQLLNSPDNETRVLGLSLLEKDPITYYQDPFAYDWKELTFFFNDDLIKSVALSYSERNSEYKAHVFLKLSCEVKCLWIEDIYLNQKQYAYFYDKWMLIINNKDFNK